MKDDGYIASSKILKSEKKLLVGTSGTRTDAGAISLTETVTKIVTTGAKAMTLADGDEGQIKILYMKTDGGDATVTPSNFHDGTTITFSAVGQSAFLVFVDSAWKVIGTTTATIA